MKYHLLILFGLFSATVSAQYIDVQFGSSVATGGFSNSTLGKNEDGFAKNGIASSISLQYNVYKQLGICTKINLNTFAFNTSEFSTQTNNQAPQGTTITVDASGKYRSTSALAGVYLALGKQKLSVNLHVLAGFLSLTSPQLNYTSTYQNTVNTSSQESYKSASAAIGYGVSMCYVLPKNFVATLNIDNVNASLKFPKSGYQTSNNEEITKPFQAYAFTLGIGYKIQ